MEDIFIYFGKFEEDLHVFLHTITSVTINADFLHESSAQIYNLMITQNMIQPEGKVIILHLSPQNGQYIKKNEHHVSVIHHAEANKVPNFSKDFLKDLIMKALKVKGEDNETEVYIVTMVLENNSIKSPLFSYKIPGTTVTDIIGRFITDLSKDFLNFEIVIMATQKKINL